MTKKELDHNKSIKTADISTSFHLRFQELLKNTSFIGFARKSGLSDKSVRDYFYGKTVPNIQKVQEIAELLDCNPSWLAFGIGTKEKIFSYPTPDNPERLFASEPNTNNALTLYTSSPHSHAEEIFYLSDAYLKKLLFALIEKNPNLSSLADNLEGLFTRNKLSLPFNKKFILNELKSDPEHLFAYQVSSDSMSPSIKNQDIILVNTLQSQMTEGIYLLLINGTLVLRHIQQLVDNKLQLSCTNPLYSPEIIEKRQMGKTFFILGEVIWVGNKLV